MNRPQSPRQRSPDAKSLEERGDQVAIEFDQVSREDGIIEISRPDPPKEEISTQRCWICFEEEDEVTILAEGSNTQWRHPCKCSLMAHEECLLSWVDETQKSTSSGVNSSRTIRCPQCKEPYRIFSRHALTVSLLTFADNWITRGLLATIPIGIAKAVGLTCFYYGQGAMLDVLGEERLTDLILSLKSGDELRYLIGASCIPFALIGSRFDLCNFVLPLIPSLVCFSDKSFILAHHPMQSSPALWICVLPWLRNIYCLSWKLLIGPIERKWRAEAGLAKSNAGEIAPGIEIFDVRGQEVPQDQHGEAIAAAQEQDDGAFAETWLLIEAPRFARLIAGALLLPKVSAIMASTLGRIPGFKSRFPHRFQRVIIGGVSFVLLKDMMSLLYLYNRAKGRSTRQIHNREPFQRTT